MRIEVDLAFDELGAVRLLKWLADENAIIHRELPRTPLLYDSGVVYRREAKERWSDVLNMYAQGFEDCDALAAARAGELKARGWRALDPRRGDYGADQARRQRLGSIPAEVVLRTRAREGRTGLYHCIVKYRVGDRTYYDDPSARLGMYGYIDLNQPPILPLPTPPRPRRRAA